ncbi:MAG: hypothetical protein KDI42_05065 [Gammaproteobacteria bacterium]|nr:hypothetical protein [Gammaproteobacteria bacterium]
METTPIELTFLEICEVWVKSDHWPLEDACRLLLELPPRVLGASIDDAKRQLNLTMLLELATNCLGASLPTIAPDPSITDVRVAPDSFLEWARTHKFSRPRVLMESLYEARTGITGTSPDPLKKPERMKERTRAIAALLWHDNPEITIAAMCKRSEIVRIALEGERRSCETIRQWVKDLAPNRSPGRRPSS